MTKEKTANNAGTPNNAGKKQNASPESQKNKGFINYLKGARQEMKKVVWPTREELTVDTVAVFATCAFFAIAFWLIDTGFLAALKGILGVTLS